MNPSLLWIGIFITYAVYTWVLVRFCSRWLGGARTKEWVVVSLLLAAYISLALPYEAYHIPYILYAFLRHLLFLGLVLFLFHGNKEKKLLVTVVLITMEELALNFSNSFFSCLLILFLKQTGLDMNLMFDSWLSRGIDWGGLCIAILAVCLLSKALTSVFFQKTPKEYLALSIPFLFMIAVIDIVNFGASNGIVVVSGVIGAEYGRIWYNALFSHMALCLLTALLACMAGGYLWTMERIRREQRKKEQYRSQAAFYKMLEEQYTQMERLRHDMKNHVIGLQGLWESRDWEKMGSYLNHMLEAGNLGSREAVTGNQAVDALLYRKQKQAEEQQILWECDAHIPKNCGIEEFDLCVLLGNALDNALAACERIPEKREKWIQIQLHRIKNCLLFEVRNSMEPLSGGSHAATGAQTAGGHGIGLLNINDTVQKYHGVVNTEVLEKEYVISILLPMQESVYDNKETV